MKTSRNGPREESKSRLYSSIVSPQRTGEMKKDMLDQVEEIEVVPNLPRIDPNMNEDSREYHEILIRQLDILVNHTFQIINGRPAMENS